MLVVAVIGIRTIIGLHESIVMSSNMTNSQSQSKVMPNITSSKPRNIKAFALEVHGVANLSRMQKTR